MKSSVGIMVQDTFDVRSEIEELRREIDRLRRAVVQIADIINHWMMVRYPEMGDRIVV